MLNIIPLPALQDNYIWTIRKAGFAVIVDPGDADVVISWLNREQIALQAILITHHHQDHTDGVAALVQRYGCPVYGPALAHLPCVNKPVEEGDTITFDALGIRLTVLSIPGHTASHIAFSMSGHVFVGDTLFSAGCGRVFDGTIPQLFESLQRLLHLPEDTLLYPAHEYTLTNLAFAQAVEPANKAITDWKQHCEKLCQQHQPTIPTSIMQEKQINPFLRTSVPAVRQAAKQFTAHPIHDDLSCFTVLREWKNNF